MSSQFHKWFKWIWDFLQPKWSTVLIICMYSIIICPRSNLTAVLSSSPSQLCGSLYGLSILAFDGCSRRAVLQNGKPVSHKLVAKFRSWPLKWHLLWDFTRVMSEMRSYCSVWVHFFSLKRVRGSFPLRPTANIVNYFRECWNKLVHMCVCIYVLVCIVLAVISVQSFQ